MTAHRLIRPFWERRWLITATTVTVLIGTFCWTQQLPDVYISSAVLTATSKDGSAIPPGQVPRLYRELASAPVLNRVLQSDPFKRQRESGATTEDLVARLMNSTQLLEEHRGTAVVVDLSYADLTPESAEAGANLLSQAIASAELERKSENNFAFTVAESATPAAGPIKPRPSMIAFYAVAGGLLLGLVFAGVSEVFKYRRHAKFDSPSMRAT